MITRSSSSQRACIRVLRAETLAPLCALLCSGADKAAVLKEAKGSLSILTKEETEAGNTYIKV
jgi:hypothetical protein